jgi:hypothetical protein
MEAEKPKRQPGSMASSFVLALMFGGLMLTALAPVVLAPPRYQSTWVFYMLVLLAWMPVYIVLVLLKIIPARKIATIIFVGLIVSCCGGTIFSTYRAMLTMGVLITLDCEEEATLTGLVRYTCTRFDFDTAAVDATQIIEGQPGSMFFRLVETRYEK